MATFFFSNYLFARLKFKLPSEQRMLNSGLRELAEQQFIFFPSCIKWWNRWLLYLNQQSHMKERATSGQTPRKMVFIKHYHPKKLIHYSDNCLNFKSFISQRCSYRRQLNSTSLRSVEHISTVIIFHSLFKIKMHFRLAVTCILT